ncbi:MAG: hypothetical protein RL060_1299 [Bacteroidota bacterium]|jgi:hypothetical protein
MQANHAQSLNCLALDLIKNALSRYSREAVKNKTLFEPHDFLYFQQIWGRVCFVSA